MCTLFPSWLVHQIVWNSRRDHGTASPRQPFYGLDKTNHFLSITLHAPMLAFYLPWVETRSLFAICRRFQKFITDLFEIEPKANLIIPNRGSKLFTGREALKICFNFDIMWKYSQKESSEEYYVTANLNNHREVKFGLGKYHLHYSNLATRRKGF